MSYRYFRNFAEFKKVTGCDIGTAITTRFKDDSDDRVRLVVAFNDGVCSISLGTQTFSYREIFDNYLFLNKKTGKFELLGIEIEDEPKPKKVRPAKFKVGHSYQIRDCIDRDEDCGQFRVIAKYRHPDSHEVEIIDRTHYVAQVETEDNGDEFITLCSNICYAKDEITD